MKERPTEFDKGSFIGGIVLGVLIGECLAIAAYFLARL